MSSLPRQSWPSAGLARGSGLLRAGAIRFALLVLVTFLLHCGARSGLDAAIAPMTAPPASDAGTTAPADALLFGGELSLSDVPAWTWNDRVWTQVDGPGPGSRYSAMMAPLNNTLLLFGGADQEARVLSDIWTWDGSSWTARNVPGPAGRWEALMAALGDVIVLFGGDQLDQSPAPFGETWT